MCEQWDRALSGGWHLGGPHAPLPVPGWPQPWLFPLRWGTLSLPGLPCALLVLLWMAFTPLKPPQLCTGEGLCGCWLQPRCFRAWFQPCLWRPIFNIKTNQCKWNLYYLLKTQVNRAEDSALRKPLGFVQGITTNILHPFWDSRQPQEVSAEDSCWNTPGCIADQGDFWDLWCKKAYTPAPITKCPMLLESAV